MSLIVGVLFPSQNLVFFFGAYLLCAKVGCLLVPGVKFKSFAVRGH